LGYSAVQREPGRLLLGAILLLHASRAAPLPPFPSSPSAKATSNPTLFFPVNFQGRRRNSLLKNKGLEQQRAGAWPALVHRRPGAYVACAPTCTRCWKALPLYGGHEIQSASEGTGWCRLLLSGRQVHFCKSCAL